VAAYRAREAAGPMSRELLRLVREADLPLIEPTILPVENCGGAGALGRDSRRGRRVRRKRHGVPYLALQTLDERMARRTIAVAAQCRLRGADALYVAAAAQYGARLVTRDAEQLERAPAHLGACKPDAAVRLIEAARKK